MNRSDRVLLALVIALGLFTTVMLHAANKAEINELKARVANLEEVVENQGDWTKYFYNKDH